jgi:hypothetical protein
MAVGNYQDGSQDLAMAERWNGTAWSLTAPVQPSDTTSVLRGVSCASATSCVAVGDYFDASNAALTLIETWNGSTWSMATSPSPSSAVNNLDGVSCVTAGHCTRVGRYFGSVPLTLVESWNGSSWKVVTSPDPDASDNLFFAVSCASASNCAAVGEAGSQNLAASYNGTAWTTRATPDPGISNTLSGVSCASAASCIAAGQNAVGSVEQTLPCPGRGPPGRYRPASTRVTRPTCSTGSPAPA